jgi:hypothetical protein
LAAERLLDGLNEEDRSKTRSVMIQAMMVPVNQAEKVKVESEA